MTSTGVDLAGNRPREVFFRSNWLEIDREKDSFDRFGWKLTARKVLLVSLAGNRLQEKLFRSDWLETNRKKIPLS